MVSSVTRLIDVNANGKWALAYRQYVGNFLIHGQIGAATSTDYVNWEIEYNVNHNGNPPLGWRWYWGMRYSLSTLPKRNFFS